MITDLTKGPMGEVARRCCGGWLMELLVASLLLVVRPGAPSSDALAPSGDPGALVGMPLLLVAMPGDPSSDAFAPSSDARSSSRDALAPSSDARSP